MRRALTVSMVCLVTSAALGQEQAIDAEQAAATKFGGTCEDVKALQTLANEARTPRTKSIYQSAADTRRASAFEKAAQLVATIREAYGLEWFASGDKPDGSHSTAKDPNVAIASIRPSFERLSCFDPARAAAAVAALDEVSSDIASLRADELACRKSTKCIANRYAGPVCELLAASDMLQQSITEERANPAGVVSLETLHSLGESLQANNLQLKDAQAEFKKKARRRFTRALCKELDEITPEAVP